MNDARTLYTDDRDTLVLTQDTLDGQVNLLVLDTAGAQGVEIILSKQDVLDLAEALTDMAEA